MDKTILVGGKAGAGIREAGRMLAGVLSNLGYYVFAYVDYPSLIRGGHNFVQVRFSDRPIYSVDRRADIIVATDGRSIKAHLRDAKEDAIWVINEKESLEGAIRAPFKEVAPGFFKSSSVLGVVLRLLGIPLEEGLPAVRSLPHMEKNEQIYREAYDSVPTVLQVDRLGEKRGDILTGSEAIALGAVDGGLEFYIAYPMTPASPILHYLAKRESELGVKVIHPENEIGVINMAVGVAFAGRRVMVGTSGGGFALMTEALSLIGMSEVPVVIYEAQRVGPSTGAPTYTAQSDLLFATFAGHGDFPKVVLAPAEPEEAYLLARDSINLAWRFQIPVIILGDKHLAESYFSVGLKRERVVEEPKLWSGEGEYRRYEITEDGISPLAFPGTAGVIVKGTSYEHDERGFTVEEAEIIKRMQDKRMRKGETLREYILSREDTVAVGGDRNSKKVVLTWGSTWGSVVDVAGELGLKVVRPVFLEPFPEERLKRELDGAQVLISVECSASGQFEKLLSMYGIRPNRSLRKYDGRPFFRDELLDALSRV